MPRALLSAVIVGSLALLQACKNPSGLGEQVDFSVTPLALQADSRIVAYHFVVTNRSTATIWMSACDRRTTPDIAVVVNGRTVDTFGGATCLAIYDMGPISLGAGESYAGDRSVPYQAGVHYVPYLGVGRDREMQTGARLQANAFDVP